MRACLIIVAVLLAGPVLAAEPEVYRLTPEQKEAAINSASRQPERAAPLLMPNPEPGSAGLLPSAERDAILGNSLYGERRTDKKVHGEVGMFIGSGGARGIYGTTAMPLGENGVASFSFEHSRLPSWNRWNRLGTGQRW